MLHLYVYMPIARTIAGHNLANDLQPMAQPLQIIVNPESVGVSQPLQPLQIIPGVKQMLPTPSGGPSSAALYKEAPPVAPAMEGAPPDRHSRAGGNPPATGIAVPPFPRPKR